MNQLSEKILVEIDSAAREHGWHGDFLKPYEKTNEGTGDKPLTKVETAQASALGTLITLREAGLVKA